MTKQSPKLPAGGSPLERFCSAVRDQADHETLLRLAYEAELHSIAVDFFPEILRVDAELAAEIQQTEAMDVEQVRAEMWALHRYEPKSVQESVEIAEKLLEAEKRYHRAEAAASTLPSLLAQQCTIKSICPTLFNEPEGRYSRNNPWLAHRLQPWLLPRGYTCEDIYRLWKQPAPPRPAKQAGWLMAAAVNRAKS